MHYRALITNYSDRVYTRSAVITLWTAPAVTTQPADKAATRGRTVTFTARASGSPAPTVARRVTSDGTTWARIPGANRPTLSVVVTLARAGRHYRAVFTSPAGRVRIRAARLSLLH